jgi:phage/plasmid primase-like uncharacterized protein
VNLQKKSCFIGFWNYSSTQGRSEYLERKDVGYYGIRFRSDEKYGDVAIVPMLDEKGRIWSYQILNSNGTKRQPNETRAEGLLHMIGSNSRWKKMSVHNSI